jgi:hypothetical protein
MRLDTLATILVMTSTTGTGVQSRKVNNYMKDVGQMEKPTLALWEQVAERVFNFFLHSRHHVGLQVSS